MSVFQAIIVSILYYLGNSSLLAGPIGYYTLYRPLVGGFLVGLVLGDPVTGTIVGATINLMYIGFISAGGALPGDPCLAGIMGTAMSITGGLTPEAALAMAVPIGLIGTLIWFGRMTLDTIFAHMADRYAEKGELNKVWIASVLLPQAFLFVITAVPCFFAMYYGANYIQGFIDFLGEKVLGVLITIGGMMPALGIALNMKAIFKDNARIFFFLGFLITVYFENLTMISIGALGLCAAIIYMQLSKGSDSTLEIPAQDVEEDARQGVLPKGVITRSWINWLFHNQACYNYERMQGIGFLHSMVPVISRLYKGDKQKTAEAMQRHSGFFNSEPCFGSPVVGLTVAMEEQRAAGAALDDDAITSVKTGLMGPASGIGDTVIQGVLVPLLLAFAISISSSGNIVGPVLYSVTISVIVVLISYFGFMLGYRKGSSAILNMLESGVINKVIVGAGIMGCMVLGALVANFVSLSCAVVIPYGEETFILQEQLFDVILPKMLPLLLTLGVYKLLDKGQSSIRVMLIIVILGAAGGLLGIFG